MTYEKVIVENDVEDKRLLWVKLNYPERLNVLHLQMLKEIHEAMVEADKDDGVQALLVTGVGKAFSAGADVKELMKGDFEQGLRWMKAY